TFKAVGQNAFVLWPYNAATYNWNAQGAFGNSFSSNAQNFAYLPNAPSERIAFNQGGGYRDISWKIKQFQGNIYRTITFWWVNSTNNWSTTVSDWNSSTNVTTNTNKTVAQTLASGVDYIADLKVEGSNLNAYIYQKG